MPSDQAPDTGRTTTNRRSYAGRTLAERKSERRERFRAAGLELFGTVGYARTTISALCTEAGLSRRQFYEEYAGSEELLIEVYDMIHGRARDAVVAALTDARPNDIHELAHVAMAAYVDTIATDERHIRCSFIEVGGVSERVEEHRLAGRAMWADFMADTISTVPGTTAVDIDYPATAFIGALTSVVHRWGTSDPRPDSKVIVDLLADMLVHISAPLIA